MFLMKSKRKYKENWKKTLERHKWELIPDPVSGGLNVGGFRFFLHLLDGILLIGFIVLEKQHKRK